MPSLQDLPLELRQKIYALAISSSDTTKIAAYPRQNNSGRRSTEVALPVLEDGQAQRTRNHNTSLLWVSKQVSADARPILYGYHKFTFETTRALELFLDQIGDMKQYLRQWTSRRSLRCDQTLLHNARGCHRPSNLGSLAL
jgi:hypothetical protein